MKLRPFPVALNGNILQPDEFGYRVNKQGFNPPGVDAIEFRCPVGKPKQCLTPLTLGDPVDAPIRRWHWDGNMEAPTITPSIGCDQAPRCGWHGHITAGERTP